MYELSDFERFGWTDNYEHLLYMYTVKHRKYNDDQ